MSRKVVICGVDTASLPRLDSKQTELTLRHIKNGDNEARRSFICANLRLVLSVVSRYNNRTDRLDDLFQAGCIGLVKAVDNFDLSVGVKFSTYAVPMIIGEVRKFFREANSLKVSRSIRDTAYYCLQARELLESYYNRELSVDEIASALDISPSKIVYSLNAISDPVSLHECVFRDGESEGMPMLDSLCVERGNTDDGWVENVTLSQAVNKLCEREQRILRLRFYEGKTQTEVSEQIGISQAQVSRLEKLAIQKLRKNMSDG